MGTKTMSIIIPAYNEELMLLKAANVISNILNEQKIQYEIIFVNDGSKDGTWEEIEKASKHDQHIIGLNFSRNFGKEAAVFAGLAHSSGDCCAVIDCDLQHPPEVLVEMYRLWLTGYEIVEGVKTSRGKESFLHKISARCFYGLISNATNIDMKRASDFKLLDRRAVDVLLTMSEKNVFFRALSSWIGFKSTVVEFEVREREIGESKWSTWSLIKYAITNITSFSAAPMQIVTLCGIVFLIFAVALGIQSLYMNLVGRALEGFTTVIILLLIIGSITMISLGIIGYYIAKIYEEIKGRPRYIISKSTKEEKEVEHEV